MKTRRLGIGVVACLLAMLVAGLVWHFAIGPGRMVAAIQRGDTQKIGLFARLWIRPDSDAFLVGGFMHCAAASGQTKSMAELQNLGANVNRIDGYGVAPVHVAVHFQRIESLRWLMAHGADPSIRDRDGRTAADYIPTDVAEQQRKEFLSILEQTSNKLHGANSRLGHQLQFGSFFVAAVAHARRWARGRSC